MSNLSRWSARKGLDEEEKGDIVSGVLGKGRLVQLEEAIAITIRSDKVTFALSLPSNKSLFGRTHTSCGNPAVKPFIFFFWTLFSTSPPLSDPAEQKPRFKDSCEDNAAKCGAESNLKTPLKKTKLVTYKTSDSCANADQSRGAFPRRC